MTLPDTGGVRFGTSVADESDAEGHTGSMAAKLRHQKRGGNPQVTAPSLDSNSAQMKAEAKIRATIVMTLMTMFIAGPDVSLKGSPTVSPMTAALCCSDPLPP